MLHSFRPKMWQMCVFMGNLAARSLSVIFRLWPKILNLLFSWNSPPYNGCSIMRALQKQLQVFTEVIQIRSFLIFPTIYVQILYLPTFSESNAWGFTLLWPGFPEMSRRLSKISDNFPKTSELRWKCPQVFRRRLSTLPKYWKDDNC